MKQQGEEHPRLWPWGGSLYRRIFVPRRLRRSFPCALLVTALATAVNFFVAPVFVWSRRFHFVLIALLSIALLSTVTVAGNLPRARPAAVAGGLQVDKVVSAYAATMSTSVTSPAF